VLQLTLFSTVEFAMLPANERYEAGWLLIIYSVLWIVTSKEASVNVSNCENMYTTLTSCAVEMALFILINLT
jgi:hypothetical protein